MRGVRAYAVVAVAMAAVLARGSHVQADPRPPWRDAQVVDQRFAEACKAVESACGARFSRPYVVRAASREEAQSSLREAAPAGSETIDTLRAALPFGVVVPSVRAVLFVPANLEARATAAKVELTVDVLRLALVREAVRALDMDRFSMQDAVRKATTPVARGTVVTVLEGHVAWVTHMVALDWGARDAERVLDRLLETKPEIEGADAATIARLVEALTLTRRNGSAFVRAVAAERGTAGVEAVLRQPPTDPLTILDPQRALDPPKSTLSDLDVALLALHPLVGDPAWTSRTGPWIRSGLEALLRRVPEGRRAEIEAAFSDGRILVATAFERHLRVMAFVASFRDEDAARAFVAAMRGLVEVDRDGAKARGPSSVAAGVVEVAVEDGAGPKGRFEGLVARTKSTHGGSGRRVEWTVAIRRGLVGALVLAPDAPEVSRGVLDEAIERFVAAVDAPEQARARGEARAVPAPSPTVLVRVVDPDGKPVDRARVRALEDKVESFADAVSGVARFPFTKKIRYVNAYQACAADGSRLGLGDSGSAVVDPNDDFVELRLRPGGDLTGRVRDVKDAPWAGVHVTAFVRSPPDEPPDRQPRAEAVTGQDGTFRLTGLARGVYYDVTFVAPGLPPRTEIGEAGDGELVVRIVPPIDAVLTVRDEASSPVAGAKVVITQLPRERRIELVTGGDGVATARALDPEVRYRLQVSTTSGAPEHESVDLVSWSPAATWSVYLQRIYSVSGIVRDEAGKPVSAHVAWKDDSGHSGESASGDDGRFELGHVPYGKVHVVAERKRPDDSRRSDSVDASVEHPVIVLNLKPH